MRAYNIRFMKFITEANFDMNTSVISGANRGNQLNLCYEMYKMDPSMESIDFQHSTFLTCTPGSSLVDAIMTREVDEDTGKKTCEGRFSWEKRIGESSSLPPYGRVCFRPRSKLDNSIVMSWYEDVSLPQSLIIDVRCALEELDKQTLQIRAMVFEKCFPEIQNTDYEEEKSDLGSSSSWTHFCETFSKNKLLQREETEHNRIPYLASEYKFSFQKMFRSRHLDGRKTSMSHILEQFALQFMNLIALIVST